MTSVPMCAKTRGMSTPKSHTAKFATVLVFSFAAALTGCTGIDSNTTSTDNAAQDLTGANLVGAYQSSGTDELAFYSITLSADHKYIAFGGCKQTGPGPHCFAITEQSGTWSVGKSGPELGAPGGAKQLILDDSFGQKTRYFYSISGKTLSLSTTYEGQVSRFVKQQNAT